MTRAYNKLLSQLKLYVSTYFSICFNVFSVPDKVVALAQIKWSHSQFDVYRMENLNILAEVSCTTPTVSTPAVSTPESAATLLNSMNRPTPAVSTPTPAVPTPEAAVVTWDITTKLKQVHPQSQLTFRIRVKNGRFVIIIPAKATRGNRRTEINFSKLAPEGLTPGFGEFLNINLCGIVPKWKTLKEVKTWTQNKSGWREVMRKKWKTTIKYGTRSSAKRKLIASPSPSLFKKAKNTQTVSIAVPCDSSIAVRIYERHRNKKSGKSRRPHLIVWIPTKLVPDSKEFSMGVRFGVNKIWKQYVLEYLKYAVSKWNTKSVASKWYRKCRQDFVEFTNSLFDERGFGRIPATRPWRLGPSQVPDNERFDKYIRKGWFTNAGAGKGYGVYANHSGRHCLSFCSEDKRIVVLVRNSKKLTKEQKNYRVTAGKDEKGNQLVLVPTVAALKCGVIPEAFIVNCSVDSKTASHSLQTFDHRPHLISDGVETDVEVTFDYNYTDGESSSDSEAADVVIGSGSDSEAADVVIDPTDNKYYACHPIKKGRMGQCLFVAVEHQLSMIADREDMSYAELRRLAIRTQTNEEYVPGVTRTPEELNRMRLATTYGDNHEVAALAKALKVNVRIICKNSDNTLSPWMEITQQDPSQPTIRLFLSYVSARSAQNHYMSMLPLGDDF